MLGFGPTWPMLPEPTLMVTAQQLSGGTGCGDNGSVTGEDPSALASALRDNDTAIARQTELAFTNFLQTTFFMRSS